MVLNLSKSLVHFNFTISNVPEDGLKCHQKHQEILRKHELVEKLVINLHR